MNSKDLESLLYNILSGKTYVKVDGKRFSKKFPSISLVNQLNFYEKEVCDEAVLQGSFLRESLQNILLEKGLVSLSEIEFIDNFPSKLGKYQRELYYARENPQRFRNAKNNLKMLRRKYIECTQNVNKYDSYTAEGISEYIKNTLMFLKTTYYNKKLIKYNRTVLDEIMEAYYRVHPTQDDIRELARSGLWTNMWIGLKNNGLVFKSGVSISVEQQNLLMWTRVYESINELSDPPSQQILNDNDLFDGWMACRNNGKENDKLPNHQEVFLIAETDEDIDKINEMNSPEAKQIKRQRLEFIKEHGEAKEIDLPDVRMDINLKLRQNERETIRGGK